MKKLAALAALLLAVAVATAVAYGKSSDQGRRLAGPFCVGKTFLQPIDGTRLTTRPVFRQAILRAGVVRSVALTQPCRPWENRKVGLAIPDIDPVTPGPAGPTGATGPAGANGANGAVGPAGPAGASGAKGSTGETGPAGAKGATGATGAQGIQGIPGKDGKDGMTGPPGMTGPAGPPGPPGPPGKDGKDGRDGKDGHDGLGNDVIYACVSQGGSLQLDVHGQPCDNEGHLPLKLVIVK